jgi:hypothetical protein
MQLRRRSQHPWRNTLLLIGGMLVLCVALNIPTFVNLARSIHAYASGEGSW